MLLSYACIICYGDIAIATCQALKHSNILSCFDASDWCLKWKLLGRQVLKRPKRAEWIARIIGNYLYFLSTLFESDNNRGIKETFDIIPRDVYSFHGRRYLPGMRELLKTTKERKEKSATYHQASHDIAESAVIISCGPERKSESLSYFPATLKITKRLN